MSRRDISLLLIPALLAVSGRAARGTMPEPDMPLGPRLTVEGSGYIRFTSGGKTLYARTVELTIVDGRLGHPSGARLVPAIPVNDLDGLAISREGVVTQGGAEIGRILLAVFEHAPSQSGQHGFLSSSARPVLSPPGTGGTLRWSSGTAGTTTGPSHHAQNPKKIEPPKTKSTEPAPIGSNQITLLTRVEVEGESILLRDLASTEIEPKLALIDLGPTPPLNVERVVDRNRITYKLKSAGIDLTGVNLTGPDRVVVVRKGQSAGHQQFVEAALRGAQVKGYSNLESSAPGPEMKVPIGDLQFVCEAVVGTTQELNVTVAAYVDGKRFNSRTVKLRSTMVSLRAGSIVTVRVKSNSVVVESKGKVVKTDPVTGQVTVQIADTGVQLVGTVAKDGAVEVQA